jgi:hypothetical protein
MRIFILLHRVIQLESYLKCIEELACTSCPPNFLVNSVCIVWCEPAARQVRITKERSCKTQYMMQLLYDSDGRAGN